MKTLSLAFILAFGGLLGLVPAIAADAPQATPAPIHRVVVTTTTKAPEVNRSVADGQSCPGWVDLAREVGWPEKQLPMVSAVIYFESRCLPDIKGDNGKSYSLMQIHTSSWCKPNRYWPIGYLQAMQIVKTCDDLMNPATNLRAGLEVWRVGGWKQWTTWQMASNTLEQ